VALRLNTSKLALCFGLCASVALFSTSSSAALSNADYKIAKSAFNDAKKKKWNDASRQQ